MPREGHDESNRVDSIQDFVFLSTCPVRGTTVFIDCSKRGTNISIHVPREGHDEWCAVLSLARRISIHVPREGHDNRFSCFFCAISDFYPRAP